jgi:eukaryotic-like serine/threonine-protein kinase
LPLEDGGFAEGEGATIGRYQLLEKIGEGGCGTVYMAEQEEPVRRRVALKIIKLGMDTREVIARFEAERQALAMMDHPNIAKIFDGGTTGFAKSEISNLKSQIREGRPYLVMELVRGIRITDFCDQHQYSPRQRLELFMQVCQAVQHAHQKGIIHSDLKPSNILVTVNDGVAVPKESHAATADGQDPLHAVPAVSWHAGLHESGTGGDDQPGYRHPQRHLQPGRAPPRIVDRANAL